MTKEEIIKGSKLIAEYLGWKYLPHNNLQGYPKPGWWKIKPRKVREAQTINVNGESIEANPTFLVDSVERKSGWGVVEDKFVKFVCRNHTDLRFYNSFDSLIPAIEKLEQEDLSEFYHDWLDPYNNRRSNFQNVSFSRYLGASDISIALEVDLQKR